MKKETIEEFIKEVLNEEFFTNISEYRKAERLMELSAKWQQEKSYSKQDMIDFAYKYTDERRDQAARALTPELLIKQFKKK